MGRRLIDPPNFAAPSGDSRLYVPTSGRSALVSETYDDASGRLVNAQSAGAAANISDHFNGASVPGAWSFVGGSGTSSIANSAVKLVYTATCSWSRAYTPSGDFAVVVRVIGQCGLIVRDSATADAAGSEILVNMEGANTRLYHDGFAAADATLGMAVSTVWQWQWLRLARVGSLWTASYSAVRGFWQTVGTRSESFTVAQVGLRAGGSGNTVLIDAFDVES